MPAYFITGVDTNVGKTYAAAALARRLLALGKTVGVYKPVASGCEAIDGQPVSGDALTLWEAARMPGAFADVCPQCFEAPLAPPIAARVEGRKVDAALLRTGFSPWREAFDVTLVEGAGGLLSPLSDSDDNADLARDLALPLIVVAANRLGVLNHTRLTLEVAAARGLTVAGVVLCDATPELDASAETNATELVRWGIPLIAHLSYGGKWPAGAVLPSPQRGGEE